MIYQKNVRLKKAFSLFILSISTLIAHAQDSYVDSLIKWLDLHAKIDSQYILTLHRVSYRLSETDIQKSFEYYEKVASISDSLNFTYGKSLAQINLGIIQYNSGNFDASNDAYFKAIELAELCNGQRLKAVCYNNIGENFKILKDFKRCRQYVEDAISLNKTLNANRGVAINYELLHQCSFNDKLYNESKEYLEKGLPYAVATNENYILSSYYVGFGKLHAINNHQDSAVYYFNKAMAAANEEGDLRNKFNAFLAKAQYLTQLSLNQKIALLDSALTIAKKTSYLEGISSASQELSSSYDLKKNKDSSLFFYRIYRSAADTLSSISNKRNVIIKDAEWEIKRKEIENDALKERTKIQREELAIKNILLLVSAVSFLLILIIIYFINRAREFKKKREEAAFKYKIAETQMLALKAQMNPNFIFNNFNSIENFLIKNDWQTAVTYFNKMGSLVNMMVDYSNKEFIPISKDKTALELYIELQQLRYHNKFAFSTSFDKKLLSEDFHVPPLLIQPYVESAIANSLAPSDKTDLNLSIKARLENDYIIYTIKDNGVGRKKLNGSKPDKKIPEPDTGIDVAEERISLLNQKQPAMSEVNVTDLYDTYGQPDGTKVEVKIKIQI